MLAAGFVLFAVWRIVAALRSNPRGYARLLMKRAALIAALLIAAAIVATARQS